MKQASHLVFCVVFSPLLVAQQVMGEARGVAVAGVTPVPNVPAQSETNPPASQAPAPAAQAPPGGASSPAEQNNGMKAKNLARHKRHHKRSAQAMAGTTRTFGIALWLTLVIVIVVLAVAVTHD